MPEKIYQEASGKYTHNGWSSISEGCGYLWDEIKDRVASGDFVPHVEAAANMYDYNESTGKYHFTTCQYCGKSIDLKSLTQLAELDASPCGVCHPPEYDGYAE